MIEVLLNKPEFEYDIHSLIKAFFPEQYVGVSAEKKEYDEKIDIRMQVTLTFFSHFTGTRTGILPTAPLS